MSVLRVRVHVLMDAGLPDSVFVHAQLEGVRAASIKERVWSCSLNMTLGRTRELSSGTRAGESEDVKV